MNLYDSEIEIIKDFQLIPTNDICLVPQTCEEAQIVLLSILDDDKWKYWLDSSGKSDPPPDFYSDKYGLMMDVMKVDDHEFLGRKGKVVNPTRTLESDIINVLKKKYNFPNNPNIQIQVLASTDLPTDEDHNYRFYKASFKRTVESHIKKIERYRENHPGYKTIFFIFDESSAYFNMVTEGQKVREGETFEGAPHYWFADKAFLDVFKDSEIDFLIWYTPYKHCTAFEVESGTALVLPRAVIYDVKNIDIPLMEYDELLMESSEI